MGNHRYPFFQGVVSTVLGAGNQLGRSLFYARADHSHPTTPSSDNATDFATAALRWAKGYFTQLRPGAGAVIWTSGAGTPEASVTAPVGSLYTRSDGGANTTLYVKESGAGNTGWVAK